MTMKLWRRASALLKDRNSICIAKLSRKTSFRNPELEEAVIKATSHHESSVDYKNAQRVFTWIRTSPRFLKPAIWSLSARMDKTRCWVVALKGIMLMHGIFCCKIPAVQKIGRLPFDFSNFIDAYSHDPKTWGYNAFIRAYFAFLDQKSAFGVLQGEDGRRGKERSMLEALDDLQKSQALLDLLLQVNPLSDGWTHVLVLEAMDCIVIEIFDVYSKICNGIAGVLVRIYTASQVEAEMALRVLHRATSQGDELDSYFEFCREIGVLKASEFPTVERIPMDDIRALERLIYGISNKKNRSIKANSFIDDKTIHTEETEPQTSKEESVNSVKTIVTDNWVVFDDEFKIHEVPTSSSSVANTNCIDPFAASVSFPLLTGSSIDYKHRDALLQMQHFYSPLQGALSTAGNQRNLILSL